MKAWRAERNWWISLFSLTLWLMVWRSATWVQGLIDEEQKDSQQGNRTLLETLSLTISNDPSWPSIYGIKFM